MNSARILVGIGLASVAILLAMIWGQTPSGIRLSCESEVRSALREFDKTSEGRFTNAPDKERMIFKDDYGRWKAGEPITWREFYIGKYGSVEEAERVAANEVVEIERLKVSEGDSQEARRKYEIRMQYRSHKLVNDERLDDPVSDYLNSNPFESQSLGVYGVDGGTVYVDCLSRNDPSIISESDKVRFKWVR